MQKIFLAYNKNIPIKKSWGQNFLIDSNTIDRIIEIINPKKNEEILEIGPGHGALTNKLITLCKKLYAVEIDPLLCKELEENKYDNLILLNEDILKWEYDLEKQNKIKIVGNLPYYISSPIIFKFLNNNYWEEMIIMLQKEVAQRIISTHNNKNYSRISVMCQTFCEIKYNMEISKNSFYPKPKVDSAIISLKRKHTKIDIEQFSSFIKQAFSKRRKTLRNNFKGICNIDFLNDCSSKRAQELTVQEFTNLYKKKYI